MIIVSACLAGFNCRYDGRSNERKEILKLVQNGIAVPLCPEQLGGLPTPRTPAEIQSGDGYNVLSGKSKIYDNNGHDVTACFIKGAQEIVTFVRIFKPQKAILKQGSPSCGCGWISTKGERISGDGVLAAFLKNEGIQVEAMD